MPNEDVDIIRLESAEASLHGLTHLLFVMVMNLGLDKDPVPCSLKDLSQKDLMYLLPLVRTGLMKYSLKFIKNRKHGKII